MPELPAELALPEFLHTSGRDELSERREEVVPPFFKYMRTKLASPGSACMHCRHVLALCLLGFLPKRIVTASVPACAACLPACLCCLQANVGVLDTSEERYGAAMHQASITVPSQKARLKVPRFLNRLLGLPIADQDLLFQVGG